MLKDKIIALLEPHLENDTFFVVDIQVHELKTRTNITILLDSDEGIKIEECAKISRRLANEIETLELITSAYNLEVSSPGIDQPLTLIRQYVKNVGRSLKIHLKEGGEKVGTLEEVKEDGIIFLEELKKKPKKGEVVEPVLIPFTNIDKAKVQISFK
ncbi:ribosome maturation factor RimP [Flectobacillus major]|jgi:ribosome maturation factor RimP|uniref:ribosome maturation factor RimP n=1 Tax=Flectobacillus major TaxID=103 RepID=UPI000404B30B|nr:ribosome maturation factor [Flectobacillus major]